jgi:hypothetical protein
MLLRLIAVMLLCIVTANTPAFGVQPNVKTGDNYYTTVTEALADAVDSSNVFLRNREFVEGITFARPGVSLNLKGGYASDFTTRSGGSSIYALTVDQGALTIDNLTITSSSYLPGDVMDLWEGGPAYYSEWAHGPSTDTNIFPIAVWLQTPSNANAYKAIGVNYFVGLWEGPTEVQLSSLTTSTMPVIADQNTVGLNSANNSIIKVWLHMDEPDNAQSNGTGGYDPPVLPSVIISRYQAMKAADATRPVYLNLGQGVAWDGWYGRGTRTNHPEDYTEYAKGADILSYDIYPVNSTNADTKEKLWLVAFGVDRLRQWSNYQKPVWNWIETTKISASANRIPTPIEVKAEVWMSIIHGARGLGYFCHQWDPFIEAGLLSNAEMKNAVAAINAQITSLTPILNTQTVANGVITTSSNTAIPIDTMVKRFGGYTCVFALPLRPGSVNATLTLRGFTGSSTVEVVGEGRTITASNGVFEDAFSSYAVHIYKIANPGM